MTNQSEKGSSGQSHQGGSHGTTGASQKSGGQQEQADKSGGQQHGGSGNFKDNPEKASEAGRKGGQHSHGK